VFVIARVLPLLASLAVALAFLACASIDPPAPFEKPDAVSDPSSEDAGRCGRILPRRFTTNARAMLYDDPAGAQAICVTLELDVIGAATGQVTFCVAGDLDDVTVPTVREIGLDSRTCAYCIDVQTNCAPDGGPETCVTQYAPIGGRVRIVRLRNAVDEEVWIDVGDLAVARREGTSLELLDCLFADGLTFQGKLVLGTCTNDTFECRIANSAASRFP
jgi:hypothetical protein